MCPMYSFINETTGEEFEQVLSYSEKDSYLAENPHIKQSYSKAPAIVRGRGLKTDNGWKEVLGKIKKGSGRGNTINV
jgi:hypothetical protein